MKLYIVILLLALFSFSVGIAASTPKQSYEFVFVPKMEYKTNIRNMHNILQPSEISKPIKTKNYGKTYTPTTIQQVGNYSLKAEPNPSMKRATLILIIGIVFFALSLLMTFFYYPIPSFILLSSLLLLFGIINFFMNLANKGVRPQQ